MMTVDEYFHDELSARLLRRGLEVAEGSYGPYVLALRFRRRKTIVHMRTLPFG